MAKQYKSKYDPYEMATSRNTSGGKTQKTYTSASGRYNPYQMVAMRNLDLDGLQSDITSSYNSLQKALGGWQTQETMVNTLNSVKSAYSRINEYQNYQKQYGGADLSELQSYYKDVINNWDSISSGYKPFKNADAYNKENARLKELGGMTSSDVKAVIDGFKASDIENKYNTAKKYDDELKSITKNSMNVRSRTDADKVKVALQKATDTRDNYLKSIGYKSMEDLEKDMSGTRIAHTTVDGQNILWDTLYKQKKYNEESSALHKEISSMDDFEKYRGIGAKENSLSYKSANEVVSAHNENSFFDNVKDSFGDMVDLLKSGKSAPEYIKSQGNVNLSLAYLNQQEKDIYNYYRGKEAEGLEAQGTADKYISSIGDVLTDRYKNKQILHTVDFTNKHPWLASGASVGLNVLSAGDAINNTVKYATKGELDKSFAADQSSTIRGTVSNKIDWEIGNFDAFDFVYNTGMSMADSAVAMSTMGVAGGAVLGLSAAAQGTNDALERGLDNKSAFWSGFASGVNEALFESLSIGQLKKFKSAPVGDVKTIIKNVGKSMLTNASEETLTELANLTYDYIANGDLSQAETKTRAYMSAGMSEEEATKKVFGEQVRQVAEAGASGALMGLAFGGTTNYSAYRNNKAVGKTIKGNERTSEVFDIASNPEVATAYEAYTNYANKGINADNIKDAQLGNLYISAKQDAIETINSKDATPEQKASAMATLGKLAIVDTENTDVKKVKDRAKELNVGEESKVTDTGESLKIKGIEKSGDETFVVTDNGKVSLKDATLTQKDAELVAFAESISQTDGTDVANLFVSQYDGKMDVTKYTESFNLTMAYAKNNYRYDEILNKKGELTATQVSAIYKEVRIKADKQRQEAIKKLNKKMADGKFYKGLIDDSVIDYNNTSAEGKVNWNDLTSRQREAVTFIKGFAQATGMNLLFVANNPKFNGRYDKTTNTITINLDKGGFDTIKNIEETIIPTMSHETTHWMKDKSPELWRHLNEIVFSTLTDHYNSNATDRVKAFGESAEGRTITEKNIIDRELNRLKNREIKNGVKEEDIDYDALEQEARDEIIARACEDMLKMSEQGKKIFSSLSEAEQKGLVAKIKAIVKDLLTWVDNLLNSYDAKSEEARIMREYKEQLQKAEKVWSEMLKKSVVANQSLEKSGAYNRELANVGLQFDAESKSVAPNTVLSEKTWTESEYVQDRETAIKAIVKALGVTESDAERYVDNINGIARMIADDRARLDYDSNVDEFASVLKSNKEYKWTVDMSTLCAKRLLFTGTFDAIQKKLPNMAFNSEDIVALRSMMMERGYEVACGICYVESTRRELGTITADFIERYKLSQKTGKPITRINSEGKVVELTKSKELLEKSFDKTTDRFIADKDYTPTLAELNTTDIDIVKTEHPLVYEAYFAFMKARGQATPKLLETRAEYKGEILKHFKSKTAVKSRNDAGGLRVQSFSGFEVAHLIDMMQIVLDMSRVGLMSQAYTKVPAFADVFGNTGMKINLSLIAKGSGLDANGNLIFDDVEGMPHKEAFRLRDKYSKNVGTIVVGKNDDHIKAALADPRIDFVIPFHKSFWKESLYEALGLEGYEDYTDTQNEKPFEKGRKIKNFQPSEYWDYSKSGKENAETYLKMCAEDGRIPKFPQFRNEEGYWKLLIDFKMYDNDGVGSPQMAVKPEFNMDEANAIMNDYEGGHRQFPVAQDVVDDFVKKHEGRKDIVYSEKGGTEQSRPDALNSVESVRFSEKYSDDFIDSTVKSFGIKYIGDYIHVQRQVFNTLVSENFFTDMENRRRIDINKSSGMVIETNKSGIDETFSEKNYKYLSKRKKNIKLATIRMLPEIIANGTVIADDVPNNYNVSDINKRYAYIEHTCTVGGEEVVIKIDIKKSPQKNKFWVHRVLEKENVSSLPASTYKGTEAGYTTADIKKSIAHPEGNVKELFSEKGDSVYDTMGETERIIKENEKLRADVERLRERMKLERTVTHGNVLNNNQLLSVAGHLRKLSRSQIDKVELANKLKDLYSFIGQSENLTWEEVYRRSYVIADAMFNEAKPDIEVNDYFKEILWDVKNSKVRLSESQKAEASHIFGSHWNRNFFGKTIISNDGISLEAQWMEWAEKYPGTFKEDITEADMITELYNIITSVKEASEIILDYDAEENRRWLANEIYNQYWNVSSVKTMADRHEKKVKQLNFEHRKAMSELREDYNARMKEKADKQKLVDDMYYGRILREKDKQVARQKLADDIHFGKLINKLKIRKEQEVDLARRRGQERLDRYKDNAERKTRIQSIMSNILSMNEMLVKNSKDKHIPEVMKGPVTALIKAIDFSSKRMLEKGEPTKKDISLQNALTKVKDMMVKATNAHDELVELYGHGLDEDIEKMVESVDNIMRTIGDNELVLNNMTATDLQTLDKVVKTIKHAVNKLNKFHTVNHARGIANLSRESVVYMDSLGKTKIYDAKTLRGRSKKLLEWGNALPYYAFKRFGDGGMKVYEALQDGWDKFAFNIKKIMDTANETYTSKEVKEWSKEVKTFKILIPASESERNDPDYEPSYQEVQLTVPQIMSLYCLNKREQARGHLFKGGIRVADFKTEKDNVISQAEGVVFTEKEISEILDSLTDRQREVADGLQKFMNTVCAEWGNDVSMARFGYKAFGEENYFPIQSDKNNLAVNDETEQVNSLFKLLNMSFTKSTIEKANNRIVISDIFDVFAQHTSDMAKYNALALPVLDSFKWYNYTEKQDIAEGTFKTKGVKQAIENAFGKDGQNYFTTFLKDINGQQEVSRDTLGGGFFKNAKIAAVGANLRVILLQPTSYVRASAVIDSKYLMKASAYIKVEPIGMVKKLKKSIENAEKYCGMALWKSMGYYDTNVQKGVEAQIKHDFTWKDKATDLAMKGAEIADKVTWGTLWTACEFEIRDTRSDLKPGTKEYFEAVGKRLREIIYATQVVDSTMTRSQMMRSSDGKDKMLTAFASEPTLSYNMLQDAYMGLSLDARRMGKKEAWKKNGKKVARTVFAYTMTNALAALVESGFDFLRDDDDEEMDVVEFMKLYLSNFASDMSITAKIPYIKEVHSFLQGFNSSRTDTQWMESTVKAVTGWYKVFVEGKGTPSTIIKNSLKAFSDLSGLPVYNIYRDIMASVNKVDLFTTEDLNEMFGDFLD